MKSNNVPWTLHTTACVAGLVAIFGVWWFGFVKAIMTIYNWAN